MGSVEGASESPVAPALEPLAGVPAALVLDILADGVVIADDHNRILYVNRAAETLLGWPADLLVGQPLTALVPQHLREAHLAGFHRFIETGVPRLIGGATRVPALASDGSERDVELTLSHFSRPDGQLFIGALRDLGDRVEVERLDALNRYLTAMVSVALTLEFSAQAASMADAAPELLQAMAEPLEWDVAAIWACVPEDECLRCIGVWTAPGIEAEVFTSRSLELSLCKGEGLPGRVWSGSEAIWVEDLAHEVNYARVAAAARAGLTSGFGVPVLGDHFLGVVEFYRRKATPADPELLDSMSAIGRQIGQFVERKQAEAESGEQLRFLAEASAVLDTSLDFDATLQRVAAVCVPYLADSCLVDVAEPGGLRYAAVACIDPEKEATLRQLRSDYPPDPARPNPALRVMRTGVAEVFAEMPDSMWEAMAQSEEHLALLRSLGLLAGMTVPLVARGVTLGTISLGSMTPGRTFGSTELALAEDLGRRAGLAIDNARLYSERAALARKLQQNLLPARLPSIPGLEVAAHYLAAGGTEVGGDFYDLFDAGQGAWAVLIGDVAGKGADAAATTGMVRHTLRAVAMHERRPSRVLEDLNQALLRLGGDNSLCTVAYGLALATDGGLRIQLASGGHPFPLVLRATGQVEPVVATGMLVGAFPEVHATEATVVLGPGDAIVLYTDGVTERRRGSVLLGEEGLVTVLRQHVGVTAEHLASAVEEAVAAFQPEAPRDDIAVLVLRVLPS